MSGFSGGDNWAPNYIGGGNLWSDEALELAHKLADESNARYAAKYKRKHPIKWFFKNLFYCSFLVIGTILYLLFWGIIGFWPLILMFIAIYFN